MNELDNKKLWTINKENNINLWFIYFFLSFMLFNILILLYF